jgi:hypothetical protein
MPSDYLPMTRPLSKHRQEINDLQMKLNQEQRWRKHAEQKAQLSDDECKRWQEVADAREKDSQQWRLKFESVQQSWNQWIEADKGLQTKEAYAVWTPESFQQLLTLLHP